MERHPPATRGRLPARTVWVAATERPAACKTTQANPMGVNRAGLPLVSRLNVGNTGTLYQLLVPRERTNISTGAHFGISEPNRLAAIGAPTTDLRFSAGHQWNGDRGSDRGVCVLSDWDHPRSCGARADQTDPRRRKGLATAALVTGYLQVAVTVGVIGVAAILVALGAR
jgi:hypothetical protein